MFALANTCLSRHGSPVELTGDCLGRIGDMSHLDRITSDQAICHGRPIVRGLRYPVESLLELLAAGMSTEEILADYPRPRTRRPPGRTRVRGHRVGHATGNASRRRVRFLVDTQLPKHLCRLLTEMGHDAVHVSDLPNGNRSTDAEVIAAADEEGRVVVSKDSDFRHSHLLRGQPSRLLAIVTGNVSNTDLLGLFNTNADRILSALDESSFVELGATSLVVHGEPADP